MDARKPQVFVESEEVRYDEEYITSNYNYTSNEVTKGQDGKIQIRPVFNRLQIRTSRHVNRLGVMLVGWGGNNGSTFTAAIEAHKHGVTWNTKYGTRHPDWLGSLTQSSTVQIGHDSKTGQPVYVPFKDILPMVDPNDILIGGWDISSMDISEATKRAAVLDFELQQKLKPFLKHMKPKPSIYKERFIALNQKDRADNILKGTDQQLLDQIRSDIREMKQKVDLVIVIWTANTESLSPVVQGVSDTADNLLTAIKKGNSDVSPSVMFAVASILEKCPFINGSPQNTFLPGVRDLARRENSWIAGDDFKTGQTRMKSVLVDFLISSGIKPKAIASYNHLGNNDGKNLASYEQFMAKKASKTNGIDDMVSSNNILYGPQEKVDHTVVIEYIPYVGDSKRAMDEYTSELMFGGINTIVIHNTCEDTLLAVPVILDLVILTEFASRLSFRPLEPKGQQFASFLPELSMLGYMFKAPIVQGGRAVNALSKQRACILNIVRACVGLAPEHHMDLETKIPREVLRDAK